MLLTTEILNDGRLKLTASEELRQMCRDAIASDKEKGGSQSEMQIEDDILVLMRDAYGYEHIDPSQVVALTSAPMVCDDAENPTKVWAFMSYEITSIPKCFVERGYCVWEFSEVERACQTS